MSVRYSTRLDGVKGQVIQVTCFVNYATHRVSPKFTWRLMLVCWSVCRSKSVAQHSNQLETCAIRFWKASRKHMKIQQKKYLFYITFCLKKDTH